MSSECDRSAGGRASLTREGADAQLLHYRPGDRFAPHHDFHDASRASAVGGEQRAHTLLVFLSDVTTSGGGCDLEAGCGGGGDGSLRFPRLGNLAVRPRAGDAVRFANLDAAGEPEPLSLHEGVAPKRDHKFAINVWIADRPYAAAPARR